MILDRPASLIVSMVDCFFCFLFLLLIPQSRNAIVKFKKG